MKPEPPAGHVPRGSTAILRVILIYAGFAAVWILLSDNLVAMVARTPERILMFSMFKGWVFVGITSLMLYRLMRRLVSQDPQAWERRGQPRRTFRLALVMGLVILALTGVGIAQVYRQQETRESTRLQAIADLKARQITAWVSERLGDAEFVAGSTTWAEAFYRSRTEGDPAAMARVKGRMESLRRAKNFREVFVLEDRPDAAPELLAARESRRSLVGPYRAASGELHLDFLAFLPSLPGRAGPTIILATDPVSTLFPVLQAWPVPSATGEGVLFRRKGDQVQFLSESRLYQGLAVSMVRPLEEETLLAAQVLRGQVRLGGLIRGSDYRGVGALGVAQAIPGTDWFLMAKIDLWEVHAGARSQVVVLSLAGMLALFLAVVASHLFRQHRNLAEASRIQAVQKERLRALRLLDAIADGSSDIIFAKDKDGRYLLFNPEAARALGRKTEDVLGRDPSAAHGEDFAFHTGEGDRRILATGETEVLEEVIPTVRGPRTYLVTKGPLRDAQGGIMGLYGIAKDITERKDAERSATAQNLLLERVASGEPIQDLLDAITRTVEDLAPGSMVGILLCDGEGRHLKQGSRASLSEVFCGAVDGCAIEEGLGPCPTAAFRREAVFAGDLATDGRFHENFRALADQCGIRSSWSSPILASTGEVLGTLSMHHREPMDPAPHHLRLMAMATHIAAIALEAHHEERALQESGLRFRQLFEAAPVPMFLVGVGERMLAVNGQFTRTFGYSMDEVPDLARMLEVAYPDPVRRGEVRSRWDQRFGGIGSPAPEETEVACADGTRRTVLISATAIGQEFLVTLSDITDRVRAERERQNLQEEVQQAQKMESIGRLAGGVAHDFNNMLGVIVANAEMGILRGGEEALTRFEEIKKAALRSADLTHQLLAFARKQPVSPKVVDLNDAIPGMLKMLVRLMGENITLDYAQRAGLWKVRMDPSQVDQILANLAVNARDAVTGAGRMGIHTENAVIAGDDPHRAPGPYVVLEVSDTGCGMDAEVQKNIFEPFYTTKGLGKGTGLGLATVYGIVRQNGGFIDVTSAPGAGTTFRVHLPRFEGPPEGPDPVAAGIAQGGSECILVVEDEPMNLDVTGTLLRSLGYSVLEASTPGEALELLGTGDQDIRMLLTDIVMPGMNGRELVDRARALRSHLRCLFMSGYTADVIAHHGIQEEDVRLLGKPFTLQQLAGRVREVLDAPAQGG